MRTAIRAWCSNRDTTRAALLAVALFAVYAAGACPTIYVGDSGELVAAVHVLGIPHPTGYPLYVLLGKLWTLLVPVGSVAYRMSLFSAACAALAGAVLYRVGRALALRPLAALVAALLLAFSPSFWGEANVPRVYALNALFVALATAEAVAWRQRRDRRRYAAVFLICGLGASNHAFMVVYAAAFAVSASLGFAVQTRAGATAAARRDLGLVWSGTARRGTFQTGAAAAAAFAIGLLPYLYLPLRSRADPPLDWGDPETLGRMLDVVLRRGFWERAWIETPADALAVAGDYLRGMAGELTWAGAALAAAGALVARRRGWPVALIGLVMLGNLAAMAAHGSRSDLFLWHRYYIPSFAMAALLAGAGCDALLARLPRALRVAPLAIPAFLLVTGWREFDRSRYRIAEAFSRAVLQSMPPGASLIATDDNVLFVLLYLTLVEGLRPDVHLIPQGVGGADLPPLRFNPDVDPVFFTHHPNWNVEQLDIVPVGLVFQARRSGQPPPEPVLLLAELPGERDPAVPKDYLTQNLIGHFHYMLGFTFEQRDWRRARAHFDRAAAAAPDNDVLFYNLGLIFQRNGLLDAAGAAFERSQAINPRHIAGSSARTADRLADVRAEQQRLAIIEAELAGDPLLPARAPGSPAYHLRMAELLEARGEAVAARGRRLRAAEGTEPGPPG